MAHRSIELKALMYDFGPLHKDRYELERKLKDIPVQTGDILYRASDAKGPLGIPFSRIVADVTESEFSHAALILKEADEVYVLEINDQGTLKYRLLDWFDSCYTDKFVVYRANALTSKTIKLIEFNINKILEDDPDYDFSFSNPGKFYCTESVAVVYKKAGIDLIEPELIKDIVKSKKSYWLIRIGNFILSLFSDNAMDLQNKMYYVGNKERGLMSSSETHCIYSHNC